MKILFIHSCKVFFKLVLLLFFVLINSSENLRAQKITESHNKTSSNQSISKSKWTKISPENRVDGAEQLVRCRSQFSLTENDELATIRSWTDDLGWSHHIVQQYHNGIAVESAEYRLHAKDGVIHKSHGRLVENLSISVTPGISQVEAIQFAVDFVDADLYPWEASKLIQSDSDYDEPVAILVTAKINNSEYKLAYRISIHSLIPFDFQTIFVDAHTGQVLKSNSEVRYCGSTPEDTISAVSQYSGIVTITTEVNSGNYFLRECERGSGIFTFNYLDFPTPSIFFDNGPTWDNDNAAVDVHWAAEKTYDFFKSIGDSTIDEIGQIKSYVHSNSSFLNNAAYTPTAFHFGDGQLGTNNKSFTSVDIVAHEISHAVIAHSAKLKRSDQSGAIAESICDIFGEAIEAYAKNLPSDWKVGAEIDTPNNDGKRSLINPKGFGHPDTYLKFPWSTSSADNYGVHSNNGVHNYWFYLLSEGGAGTNDNNETYSVTGIGIDAAIRIVHRNLTIYLDSESDYIDAMLGSIAAADDLYDSTSNAYQQVINAWAAVGISNDLISNQNNAIIYPDGGETFYMPFSDGNYIEWDITPFTDSVRIELSINNGASWTTIVAKRINSGTYNFRTDEAFPGAVTNLARIKVSDYEVPYIRDVSDASFKIRQCSADASFSLNQDAICVGGTPIAILDTTLQNCCGLFSVDDQLGTGSSLPNNKVLLTGFDFSNPGSQCIYHFISQTLNGNPICFSMDSQSVEVIPPITNHINILANGLEVRGSTNIVADDYFWDWDDGNFDTIQNPVHVYSMPGGDYQISLIATNQCTTITSNLDHTARDLSLWSNSCQDEWEVFHDSLKVLRVASNDENLCWYSSFDGDLYFISRGLDPAGNFTAQLDPNNIYLSGDPVTALTLDNDGVLWIGTCEKVLSFKDNSWNTFSLPGNSIYDIVVGSDSTLWIAASDIDNPGTTLISFKNGTSTVYNFQAMGMPANAIIFSLDIQKDGSIWIATSKGLIYFDGAVTWQLYNKSNSGLLDNWCWDVKVDHLRDIWITTPLGLQKVDSISGWNFVSLPVNNNVRNVEFIDSNNTLINTYNGVAILKNQLLDKVYTKGNSGLSNNFIQYAEVINENVSWFSTGAGLNRLVKTQAQFEIESNEFCSGETITFVNLSKGGIEFIWEINDYPVSNTNGDLIFAFDTGGNYTISLTAIGPSCLSVYEQNVRVRNSASLIDLGGNISICTNGPILLPSRLPSMKIYQWSRNDSVLSYSRNIIATTSGTYVLGVRDSCDIDVYDTIEVLLDNKCVYPGDYDYNGVVNNKDVVPFGLFFGYTGIERKSASTEFVAQPSKKWSSTQENGKDIKHIDGDGDGIIDLNDGFIISQNYDQTHNNVIPPSPLPQSSINISSDPIVTEGIIQGDSIIFELDLFDDIGATVTAYNVTFTIDYIFPDDIVFSNHHFDFSNSWLGDLGVDMFAVTQLTQTTILVGTSTFIKYSYDVGLSRIDFQNAVGSGEIGYYTVDVNSNLATNDDFLIRVNIDSAEIGTNNGTLIQVSGPTDMPYLFNSGSCVAPVILTDSLGADTVHLEWNNVTNFVEYNVQAKEKDDTTWISLATASSNFTSIPTSILGVNKIYEWRVQTVCNLLSIDTSEWSAISAFCIDSVCCLSPQFVQSDLSSFPTVTLTWEQINEKEKYGIWGRPLGNLDWIMLEHSTNSLTFSSLALSIDTSYEWKVRAICDESSNIKSPFSELDTFLLPSCDVPTSTSTDSITASAAKLNWTPVNWATGYKIRGQASGSTSIAELVVPGGLTDHKDVFGLSPSTTYFWVVSAMCGAQESVQSPPNTFATTTISSKYDYSDLYSSILPFVRIVPNPAKDDVTLFFNNFENKNLDITLMNHSGITIYSEETKIVNPENSLSLSTVEWPTGVYFIQVRDGINNLSYKLVVIR